MLICTDAIENKADDVALEYSCIINDIFIKSNQWKEKHIVGVESWEILILNNMVCRMFDSHIIGYNHSLDVFEYECSFVAIFSGQKFENIKISYYQTAPVLKL